MQTEGRKALESMRIDFERLTQQLAAATKEASYAAQEEEAFDSAGEGPVASGQYDNT